MCATLHFVAHNYTYSQQRLGDEVYLTSDPAVVSELIAILKTQQRFRLRTTHLERTDYRVELETQEKVLYVMEVGSPTSPGPGTSMQIYQEWGTAPTIVTLPTNVVAVSAGEPMGASFILEHHVREFFEIGKDSGLNFLSVSRAVKAAGGPRPDVLAACRKINDDFMASRVAANHRIKHVLDTL